MAAITISLIGETPAADSEEFAPVRQIETVGMPLVYSAWKRGRAQPLAQDRRLDPIIADLAAFVVVTEHPRAERARQHLRAKAKAQQRFVFSERGFEPVDLAPDP